jgi:hypothetical protein
MPGYHPAPRSALFANLPIERDVLDHGMLNCDRTDHAGPVTVQMGILG